MDGRECEKKNKKEKEKKEIESKNKKKTAAPLEGRQDKGDSFMGALIIDS